MTDALQRIYLGEEHIVRSAYAQFIVQSETLEPDRITNDAEVIPTRSWRKGDRFQGKEYCPETGEMIEKPKIRTFGVWDLSSENAISSPILQDHAVYILDQLEPAKTLFQRLCENSQNHLVRFCLNWHIAAEHGSYQLANDVLHRISQISQHVHCSFIAEFDEEDDEA